MLSSQKQDEGVHPFAPLVIIHSYPSSQPVSKQPAGFSPIQYDGEHVSLMHWAYKINDGDYEIWKMKNGYE